MKTTRHTTALGNFIQWLFIAMLAMTLASCPNLWGALDNPADPESAMYQGFMTVTDPGAVAPNSTDYGASSFMPTLKASKLVGADAYQFQISTTANFATVVYTSAEMSTNTHLPNAWTDFVLSTTYYWRVRVKSGGSWAGWTTSVCTFSLVPLDFGTIAPGNGVTIDDTTPFLDWADVAGANGYELQIASTAADMVRATAISTTTSDHQISAEFARDTWYWRVRAKNTDAVWSDWSATWSFAIGSLDMVSVTGGTFNNGTSDMTVSNFAIGKYEVTFDQYDAFCDATSRTKPGDNGSGRGTRPAINVSWYDAVAFCNWLSAKEALNPAYMGSATSWTLDRTKNGYRLPTEAEWEFAARGGNSTKNYAYAGSDIIGDVAWYASNSGSMTQPVGTKAANELGLYDMSGNVKEWNHDWYGSYPSSAPTNYTGLSSGTNRVIRGCCCYDVSSGCALSYRAGDIPANSDDNVGFRVARTQ